MYHFLHRHKNALLLATQACVLLALTTPLVFIPDYFVFPFITAKVFFLRAMIVLAFGGYLALLAVDPARYVPRRNILLGALFIFFGWVFATSFFGADLYHSFWSDHERMLGIFTMIHYLIFFVILTATFTEEHLWRRLFLVVLGVGTLVLLGALLQQFDPDFLFGGKRAASTLGNPTYLSAYAAYIGFFAIYAYRAYFKGNRAAKYSLGFIVALSLGGFIWSETRGAVVGLAVAVTWMAALLVFLSPARRARWVGIGILIFFLVASATILLGAERGVFGDTPVLRRFADFSITGANETRIRTWGIALRAWQERPILGWGWLNFGNAYDAYYEPEQLKHGLGETWVDQAHNTPLETLTTTGTLGLLFYLGIWATFAILLIRAYRKERIERGALILMSGLAIFHFVQNIFVFENPVSYLLLFVLFGWVMTREDRAAQDAGWLARAMLPQRAPGVVILSVVLVVVGVYYGNVTPARANHLEIQADKALARGEASLWFGYHEQALALVTPHKDDIRREMARTFTGIDEVAQLPKDALDSITTFLVKELAKNSDLHPGNVRMALEYGETLMFQYEHLKDRHPEAAAIAERVYETAQTLSPRRQQVGLLHANALTKTADFQKARTVLLRVRSLSPSLPIVHRLLGEFFVEAGLYEEAITSYEAAIAITGAPEEVFSSLDEWQRFGLLHIEHGNTLRGAWALDTVMSCTTGRVKWRECAEGPSPHFATFRPSRKAFAALILYYDKTGDRERRDFYESLAREYFVDFELPQ